MTINLRNLIDLTVPEYAITILTMFSVFLLIENDFSTIPLLVFPVFSYVFALFGFNTLNHAFDAEMDKITKPLRPVPSKRVNVKEVKIISAVFFILSFIFASSSPILLFAILSFVFATMLYSHPSVFFRKYLWATPFFAVVFYSLIPFLCVALFFKKDIPWLFLAFFSALVASVSITKDIEDLDAEKRFGIKSVPNLVGISKTLWLAIIGLFLSLGVATLILVQTNLVFLFPATLSLLAAGFVSLIILRKKFEEEIVTQSKVVTTLMVLVVLIQLLFGLTAFLSKS